MLESNQRGQESAKNGTHFQHFLKTVQTKIRQIQSPDILRYIDARSNVKIE
jgi:hypothetical protein